MSDFLFINIFNTGEVLACDCIKIHRNMPDAIVSAVENDDRREENPYRVHFAYEHTLKVDPVTFEVVEALDLMPEIEAKAEEFNEELAEEMREEEADRAYARWTTR